MRPAASMLLTCAVVVSCWVGWCWFAAERSNLVDRRPYDYGKAGNLDVDMLSSDVNLRARAAFLLGELGAGVDGASFGRMRAVDSHSLARARLIRRDVLRYGPGPRAEFAVGRLRVLLRDRDARVQSAAVHALGAIGPEALSCRADLARLMESDSLPIRLAAAEAMYRVTEETFGPIEVALPLLRSSTTEGTLRVRAASVIAVMLPSLPAGPLILRPFLTDPNAGVRAIAATALKGD